MAAPRDDEKLENENMSFSDKKVKKVKIQYQNQKCFIWNSDDVTTLRAEYRIIGSLIGCLPRAPHQNVHLGLPLELMPEEVTLLLDKGLAEVVETGHRQTTEDEVNDFKEERQASHNKQVELFRAEKREIMKRRLPVIIEGKKKKRNQLLEEQRQSGEIIDDAEFEKDIEFDIDTMDIPAVNEDQTFVHVQLELRQRDSMTCHVVDWTYPTTTIEKLRCRVFRDLWEKGHCLTSGRKFGGDFLVYAGDPSRFHSLYVAVCRPHDQEMSALDIVTMGRLGSNVKKTVVICSVDNDDNLCYISLQWTGVS